MYTVQQCNSQTCIKRSTCAVHAKRPEQGGSDFSAGQKLPEGCCMHYAEAVREEQRQGV
ncbi:hypothetical protein [Cupriavidus sp. CP313]